RKDEHQQVVERVPDVEEQGHVARRAHRCLRSRAGERTRVGLSKRWARSTASFASVRARPLASRPGSSASSRPISRRSSISAGTQGVGACGVAGVGYLGRDETGVLQDAVRDARLLGHERVVVERERPARAGKIVQLPAGYRLEYAAFSDGVESEQGESVLS